MNEEQQKQSKNSKLKTFFGKKWTFPVMYMGAAALILAFIMWYQDTSDYALDKQDLMPDISMGEQSEVPQAMESTEGELPEAVPVNQNGQVMIWPAAQEADTDVIMNFYEEEADEEVKAAALIQYEDTYWPHTGIDLAGKQGEPFEVLAALDGKVTKADKDPMVGFIVEIEHTNGITTVYQSLADVQIAEGDEVKQGDVIAKAGRNLFEKDLGVHLHFEVRENGQPVSPEGFLSRNEDAAQ
jgi:stage II sporulation protein Q